MSNIRKKAIARLHYMIGNIKDFASASKHLSEDDKADLEALGMAVKSLETDEAYDLMYEEPDFCEDCISRKTALMYIDIPQGGTLNDIRDAIRKMPSVLPKANWISVNDRLPKDGLHPITADFYGYMCTVKISGVIDVRYIRFGYGHWWYGGECIDEYVIAWMERPEPYLEVET